jgi:hypothetical protein
VGPDPSTPAHHGLVRRAAHRADPGDLRLGAATPARPAPSPRRHLSRSRTPARGRHRLSPDRAKATIISIPRDAQVDIPTCTATDGSAVRAHAEMFNSAFAIGGPKCTIKTVQKLTGIVVTHFVEIDFSGFASIDGALNGVTGIVDGAQRTCTL